MSAKPQPVLRSRRVLTADGVEEADVVLDGESIAAVQAFGLSQVISGRAAYMHVGVLIGTIMATNVWMRIQPVQKLTVQALEADQDPDPRPTVRAKKRPGHNTFLALPLIFIMVSSHFPTLSYGHRSNWLMLALFMALGFAARWLMNRWDRRG